MSVPEPRAVVDQLIRVLNGSNFRTLPEVLTDDCVWDYPQTGERIRGRKNIQALFENYPGGPSEMDRASVTVIGTDRWVMTPTFALVRLTGDGDDQTMILKIRYPDGSIWWTVNFLHLASGRIDRWTAFFAPEFEPQSWRSSWVERIDQSG